MIACHCASADCAARGCAQLRYDQAYRSARQTGRSVTLPSAQPLSIAEVRRKLHEVYFKYHQHDDCPPEVGRMLVELADWLNTKETR